MIAKVRCGKIRLAMSTPRPLGLLLSLCLLLTAHFSVRETFAQTPTNNSYTQAESLYQDALQLFRQGNASAFQQALKKLEAALILWQNLNEPLWEANTLLAIGRIDFALGNQSKALNDYHQALTVLEPLSLTSPSDDVLYIKATILNNIGSVYDVLGEQQKALEYYTQALTLRQQLQDTVGVATTLNNLGLVYNNLGEFERSLTSLNQALSILKTSENQVALATTLNNIGSVYDNLGDRQKAIDYYNQALSLIKPLGDRNGEVTLINNIAKIYDAWGEKQKALDYFNQALEILKTTGNRQGEAIIFSNLGFLYDSLGDRKTAINYYNQALVIAREVSHRLTEATALNNLGLAYDGLGETETALDYYHQALPLLVEMGNRNGEAGILNNIGTLYDNQNQHQKALEYYNKALPLFQATGNRSGEATTLTNIGEVYDDLGDSPKAINYYNQALLLRREVGDVSGEAATLYNLATAQQKQGNLTEALANIEASLKIVEDLRGNIASSELRTSYFASIQDLYQFYIDLLMQFHQQNPTQGYDGKALHASERSRARTLLEILTEANIDIRQGVEPQLLQQERTLQIQLNRLEKQRLQLANSNASQAQKSAIQKQIDQLLQDYRQLTEKIRSSNPNYAALTQPKPLTLEQIQQQILDEETILLQYALGKERSYVWVVSKSKISSYKLPERSKIETAVRNFILALPYQERANRIVNTANVLSELILQPVATELDKKRLLIVADGALQYVPFSALTLTPENYQPLILQHEIINLPSASTLAIIRQQTQNRQPATKTIAILADPVFSLDDERLKQQSTSQPENLPVEIQQLSRAASEVGINWQRLLGTRREAETIISLIPEKERSQVFDFQASREAAINPQLANYQIIHFATHGFANTENPALSGLVMSLVDEGGNWQNGYLRLNDIFNLNLPAELVVLSACQTALGANIRGEGLVSLTRGFMYAGTPRVMASLWYVDDAATADLMSKFYTKLLQEKLSPLAALRTAQIEMWQTQQWNSPYYWAAFTLQGDWK